VHSAGATPHCPSEKVISRVPVQAVTSGQISDISFCFRLPLPVISLRQGTRSLQPPARLSGDHVVVQLKRRHNDASFRNPAATRCVLARSLSLRRPAGRKLKISNQGQKPPGQSGTFTLDEHAESSFLSSLPSLSSSACPRVKEGEAGDSSSFQFSRFHRCFHRCTMEFRLSG